MNTVLAISAAVHRFLHIVKRYRHRPWFLAKTIHPYINLAILNPATHRTALVGIRSLDCIGFRLRIIRIGFHTGYDVLNIFIITNSLRLYCASKQVLSCRLDCSIR